MRNWPSTRGFTIVEMLVVLAIMGIAMLAVPAIVSSVNGSRLRAASTEVVAALREARYAAIRSETAVEIVFDLRRRRYGTSAQPGLHELPPVVERVEIAPVA